MNFEYSLIDRYGSKATLGLIVLQSDETVEQDFRRLLPQNGIALYTSRVASGLDVTHDTLAEMAQTLPAAAALFPNAMPFDVIGYGCTSGTSVIGAAHVANLIRTKTKSRHVTDPLTALIAACAHLGLRKISVLSPYIETVNQTLRDAMGRANLSCEAFGSFNESAEAMVARISPDSLIEAAIDLAHHGKPEAIFLSCTNLRTLDVIAPIEAAWPARSIKQSGFDVAYGQTCGNHAQQKYR